MDTVRELFWLYLTDDNQTIFKTKSELKLEFEKYLHKTERDDNFELMFDYLRKSNHIKYIMLNKQWAILDEQTYNLFKSSKLNLVDVIIKYLDSKKIKWYFGLENARYYLGSWQLLHSITIINDEIKKSVKTEKGNIELKKIKSDLIIEKSLEIRKNQNMNYFYSNNEKTLLDEIYFLQRLNFSPDELQDLDFDNLNLYLNYYKKFHNSKYKFIKTKLLSILPKEQRGLLF